MATPTSTAIRHIIVREYKKPNPAFAVIANASDYIPAECWPGVGPAIIESEP